MRILVVEDDRDTALTMKEELESSFIVELAFTGEECEYKANINGYDLIILDYILPDINGITVCENIRKAGIKTPILMLTGQHEITRKVMALDSGADDYMTKPFNAAELHARIRALLRRQDREICNNILAVGDLTFDLSKKIVVRNHKKLSLRRKEMYLLEYFMRNAGRVITREMILDHVWDSTNESVTNIVDVHIKYLRDIVDKPFDKKIIKTIHGLGYKLEL